MLETIFISVLVAQVLRYFLFELKPMRQLWDRFRSVPVLGKFLSCPFCQGFWLGFFIILPQLNFVYGVAWGIISGWFAYTLQKWIGKMQKEEDNTDEIVVSDQPEDDDYSDEVCLLECNIDDMSGEFFGDVMERLFTAGALDVWFTSAYGKKNRPLYQLSALMKSEDEDEGIRVLLTHSSTAGVRRRLIRRVVMQKSFIYANIDGQLIAVKKLRWRDVTKYTPEWEDCSATSRKSGRPVAEIYAEAQAKAKQVDI